MASPKHYNNMTEVEICGGGHRTRLNNQLVCLWGAPSHVYKGGEEGRAGPLMARPRGGVLLLVGVGFPPSLVGVGEEGRGRGREGKGGRPPPNSDWAWGGGGFPHLGRLLLSSTMAH